MTSSLQPQSGDLRQPRAQPWVIEQNMNPQPQRGETNVSYTPILSRYKAAGIEASHPDGLRLRAEFIWHGDRFAHIISLVNPHGDIQPLLESIEGTTADDWPSSPPLQSLSVEKLPDGRPVALLVGMAGGSHWSAS